MPLSPLAELSALLSLIIWLVLVFFWAGFWRVWNFDADRTVPPPPRDWPRVTAIIPARNEAALISAVVAAMAKQDYPGEFSVIVVDDHSNDGSAELAREAASGSGAADRFEIATAPELVSGWTGKLAALDAGVRASAGRQPEFLWFSDADIVHGPDTLRRLVSRAQASQLDLASLMVLLACRTLAERLQIPPFLYFFLMLYPPRRIFSRSRQTAGAAGGCLLLRRSALERIGGLATIRGEIIDDCALARAVKRSGGRIWMGLTRTSRSLRPYSAAAEIRDMIARTAFTQLHHSPLRLVATLAGLVLTFLAPVALTFAPQAKLWVPALLAWCLMTASFLPTLLFYRLPPVWAPTLPLAALFYSYATLLSAVRYWLGRGGRWKGRTQAKRP